MEIYLLRHGETNYNKENRIQGKLSIPLNENGIENLKKFSRCILNKKFSKIYCSSSKRCVQTSQVIFKKTEIIFDERLTERNYGEWEGMLWSDIMKLNPNIRKEWDRKGISFRPPNGESIEEIISRINDFIIDLKSLHLENDKILVITHGGPIKIFLGYSKDLPKEKYYEQRFINNNELIKIKI